MKSAVTRSEWLVAIDVYQMPPKGQWRVSSGK
jgi:hypothetical protein